MRDNSSWKKPLVNAVKGDWPASSALSPDDFFDVELGLFLLEELLFTANAQCLWVLLTGYNLTTRETEHWSEVERRKVGVARHLLRGCRSEYQWKRLLTAYRDLPESLRGFEVDCELEALQRRNVATASKRWEVYTNTISSAPVFTSGDFEWANAGDYFYFDGEERVDVKIPQWVVDDFEPPVGHQLQGKAGRSALVVRWGELEETARWMDEVKGGESRWLEPFRRVRLELFGDNDELSESQELTIDGVLHIAGMVSSGKSTLMDILAVWSVRNGLHVTLVVSDVIGALNKAGQFHRLGLSVAPVIGKSNREQHLKRLHRAVDVDQKDTDPLARNHPSFRWVSTTNPLLALRRSGEGSSRPERLEFWLHASDDHSKHKKRYASPLYPQAPIHIAQRDLVNARIWIATVPSLVCTGVDPQLNRERIRFCELVYRRSDLVIFDEADQVQTRLDDLFNPTETLVGRGEAGWLNRCTARVVDARHGRGFEQLSRKPAADWHSAHETAQTAANRIYTRLLQNPSLREWIGRDNYFSDWFLFSRLRKLLWPDEERLPDEINRFLDDPLGERGSAPDSLVAMASVALVSDEQRIHGQIERWLLVNTKAGFLDDEVERGELVAQIELSLLVTVLQDRLNRIIVDWDNGAREFALDGEDSLFFRRPPRDYEPVVPSAPMGNILAFQYLVNDPDSPGDLRFFRCMGIGRWIMLRFHELFPADEITAPNVLLLSGTSWAGTSPACHVQVQPQGVLKARDEEVQAIAKSKFAFMPLKDGESDDAIRVSGLQGDERASALRRLVKRLCRKSGATGVSILEKERRNLPEHRRRVLLLVGSYDEAKRCAECIVHEHPDWKENVYQLVRDDDEDDARTNTLPRGMVHTFPDTDGWILIAPLLAVERGHNIVNDQGKAAFGAAYFLVRPHPRPDDTGFAIQSISRWAVENAAQVNKKQDLVEAGQTFRRNAFRKWHRLLRLPLRLASLPPDEREAVMWNTLVVIWQVIGRLVRGGEPARVYFCDAAFGPRTAKADSDHPDDEVTSQLVGMRELLRPYFDEPCNRDAHEAALVRALYMPFYDALSRIEQMPATGPRRKRGTQKSTEKATPNDV